MMKQTRKMIQNAFIELARKEPVDKITVKEIVDYCQINRNSFYYHFEDLPDLIASIIEDEIQDGLSKHQGEGVRGVFFAFSRVLQDNIDLCRNVYYSKNREVLEIRLTNAGNQLIEKYLEQEHISHYSISPEDKEIIIQLYRMELSGFVREWMQSGMKYDLPTRLDRMLELRQGTLEKMLETAQRTRTS